MPERSAQPEKSLAERVYSIDVFKYLGTIAITIYHIDPLSGLLPHQLINTVTSFASIALQFFFITAGYFYYRKLRSGKQVLLPYIKRLLIPYTIWSFIYFLPEFIQTGRNAPAAFLKNCIIRFFISGSAFHFWFFPSMIFSTLLFTLLYKFRLRKLIIPLSVLFFCINVLGNGYIFLGLRIPVLGSLYSRPEFTAINRLVFMGFPYFSAGYIVSRIQEQYEISARRSSIILAAALALFFAEKLYRHFSAVLFIFTSYPLVIAILLWHIKHPMPGMKKLAGRLRVYSSFTYYAHGIFMILCGMVLPLWVAAAATNTVTFIITMLLCTGLAELIYRTNNRYLNYLAF